MFAIGVIALTGVVLTVLGFGNKGATITVGIVLIILGLLKVVTL
jgi:hypothetical protein